MPAITGPVPALEFRFDLFGTGEGTFQAADMRLSLDQRTKPRRFSIRSVRRTVDGEHCRLKNPFLLLCQALIPFAVTPHMSGGICGEGQPSRNSMIMPP